MNAKIKWSRALWIDLYLMTKFKYAYDNSKRKNVMQKIIKMQRKLKMHERS
jgi:hypothetical protein